MSYLEMPFGTAKSHAAAQHHMFPHHEIPIRHLACRSFGPAAGADRRHPLPRSGGELEKRGGRIPALLTELKTPDRRPGSESQLPDDHS